MKRQFKFFTFAASLMALFSLAVLPSCSNDDSEPAPTLLVLSASTTTFVLDEDTAPITFKATFEGTDVTSSAQITNTSNGTQVENASWTPTSTGSFTFQASYDGEVSNTVTITVRNQSDPVPSTETFYRYILLTKFTYTTCPACAEAQSYFEQLSAEDAEHYIVVAIHSTANGDRFAIPAGIELINEFGITYYPTWYYNFYNNMIGTGAGGGVTQAGLINQISRAERMFPTVLGIIAESTVEGTTAKVSATVNFQEAGDYKIACVLTENVPGQGSENLDVFKHVLRAAQTNLLGDEITPAVTEAGERTFDFSVELDEAWNVDECNFTIYVFKNEGENGYVVNNARECPVGGAVTEYKYKE